MEDKKSTEQPKQQKVPENVVTKKKPADNSEFKRRYFDYYDDIKISDRQDW